MLLLFLISAKFDMPMPLEAFCVGGQSRNAYYRFASTVAQQAVETWGTSNQRGQSRGAFADTLPLAFKFEQTSCAYTHWH